jgi:Ni/Co efflux regulator RcnB
MKKIVLVSTMMFVLTAFASTALANNSSSGDYIRNKMQQAAEKRFEARQQQENKDKQEGKSKTEEKAPCVETKTDQQQKPEYCKE